MSPTPGLGGGGDDDALIALLEYRVSLFYNVPIYIQDALNSCFIYVCQDSANKDFST